MDLERLAITDKRAHSDLSYPDFRQGQHCTQMSLVLVAASDLEQLTRKCWQYDMPC